MMRRGPLADNPIEALLATAASERVSGVIELHGTVEGQVFLVEGDVYLADLVDAPVITQRMLGAGVLTQDQVDRHVEPGEEVPYLALALDTDASLDDQAIGSWLLEVTAEAVSRFVDADEGEYELDPYGSHPLGILAAWTPAEVFERVRELQAEAAERAEAERLAAERAEAERREAERLAAERAEAERREAERVAAERAEAERVEAERVAAERAEAERAEATAGTTAAAGDVADTKSGATGSDDASSGVDVSEADRDPSASSDASAHAPAPPPSAAKPVLVVTVDVAPNGLARIELNPTEWRVVVAAARGISRAELAERLNLDSQVVDRVVTMLSDRGLLATMG